jgi:hypothetical protein
MDCHAAVYIQQDERMAHSILNCSMIGIQDNLARLNPALVGEQFFDILLQEKVFTRRSLLPFG